MEQTIPVEECAKQRLHVLVNAYTLFVKHLMEEGLDREKVKRASDKAWAVLGQQAAAQLKPAFGDQITVDHLKQVALIAESVHGIEASHDISGNQIQSRYHKCPWQEAVAAHSLPEKWTLCVSGHAAFTENMYRGLKPSAAYKLIRSTAAGDEICEGTTTT